MIDARQNRFTLAFVDATVERAYLSSVLKRTRLQGGLAIAMGIPIYLALGILDLWFVPSEYQAKLWTIRVIAVAITCALYALTYTRWGSARAMHALLALTGFSAGASLISIFAIVPAEDVFLYYGSIILATFYTYNLSGTRFIWALWVDIALIVAYNLVFIVWKQYPTPQLLVHDLFMISSNLLGGAAGYWTEFQTRRLFLRERELEQERERHMARALQDPLTNLANRDLLRDRVAQALACSQRENLQHAALFIDLDGFKRINDELGHDVGDIALKTVAQRLLSHTRETDTVARLGGDEYFILGYGIASLDAAQVLAERCVASIGQAIEGIPQHFLLSASVGICMFPYEGVSTNDLLRRADLAMYEAKRLGKGRVKVAA